jgi:hypothetical protein
MPSGPPSLGPIVAAFLLLGAFPTAAADLEALEAENARLRARIEQLERENAQLRGEARRTRARFPAQVVERQREDGSTLWATEPARIETAGRAAHFLWLERTPGSPEATLWMRTEFSGGIYRRTERLELRLDGAGHSLPVADYDTVRITAGVGSPRPQRRDHEIVRVTLTPPVLAALGEASTMSGQLGRTSFTVPPDVLASLRALARKNA